MTEQDKQTLISVIKKHLPNTQIYLFGSRARKDNSSKSDIDIAIDDQAKINSFVLSLIKEELDESSIPFTVDIIDLNNIDKDFKNQISKDLIKW